ncbi:MAG: heme o synthase [Acidimicrobiia bacterium]
MSAAEVSITDPQAVPTTWTGRLGAYVALTKPRIIELLLVTTVPAMILAERGWPGTWLVLATLVGGTMSAGGANAINNVIDRDIDQVMHRTSHRPMATHKVPPGHALVFGVVLGIGGFAWLWATTNLLAATLSTAALLFYVFVYTLWLKRSSTQNIVIGGAAGAVPVLVGWAAVSGSLSVAAGVMFAIIFYWTPPHFWALSLRYREDYARAGIPMLPVVQGEKATVQNIGLYSIQLVALTLVLFPAAEMSLFYLASAVVLGVGFLWGAWQLRAHPEQAMRFFGYSNVYLTLLFGVIAIDGLFF